MNASPSLQSSLSEKSSDTQVTGDCACSNKTQEQLWTFCVFPSRGERRVKASRSCVGMCCGCLLVAALLSCCAGMCPFKWLSCEGTRFSVFQKWCKSLFYWETNSCNMSKPTFKGQFKRSQVRGRCLLKHIHSLLPGSGLKDKETWSHLAHPALLSLTASYFRAHFKIAYSLGSPKVYLELYVAALPEMVFGCSSVQI